VIEGGLLVVLELTVQSTSHTQGRIEADGPVGPFTRGLQHRNRPIARLFPVGERRGGRLCSVDKANRLDSNPALA